MSREERTRRYETMIVFRADLQETGVKEQVERFRKLLEGQGATIGGLHDWGLRELAYEIEKERRGYYVLAEYTSAAAAVAELERQLKLTESVLRFVSVRQEAESAVAAPPQDAPSALDTTESDDDMGGDLGAGEFDA